MITSHAVDWLSITFKGGITDALVRDALSFGVTKERWTECSAAHGYKIAIEHPFGHKIMMHPGRPEMGCHVIMGGSSLKQLTEGGIEPLTLVKWAIEEGGKISRLDLAIDVFDVKVAIEKLPECTRTPDNPGTAKNWGLVRSSEGGLTAYIGSRKSDKFMRIYNKAAQMKQPERLWTRFEIELKRDTAREVAAALISMASGEIPHYFKGLMKGMFNPVDPVYQAIMSAPSVHVASTKDASDNTLDWLVNSVAKTLAKTMQKRSHEDVWGEFSNAVLANLKALGYDPFDTPGE